jgi:ankyrin repeat protein
MSSFTSFMLTTESSDSFQQQPHDRTDTFIRNSITMAEHNDDETLLKYYIHAAENGNLDRMIEVLNAAVCSYNLTSHRMAWRAIHGACSCGHLNVVKFLIEQHHVDYECFDYFANRPLHSACSEGHLEVVQYLIKVCHVEVNTRNYFDSTALHCASTNHHLNVVKYLIHECHVNVDEKDMNECTALHFAIHSNIDGLELV